MGLFSFVGDILGDITGSTKAGKKATAAATYAADQNNALARDIFGQTKANIDPFVQSGLAAQGNYNALIGLPSTVAAPQAQAGFNNYLSNFGYQSELDQGSRAITGSQAARGLLGSGSTLKALQRFGVGLRGQFGTNYLNLLGNQQAAGLQAAGALAGAGTNYTGQVSGNNDSRASAIGNSALAGAANTSNFLGSAIQAAAMASDIRLKEDIRKVGGWPDGLGLYLWRYIGDATEHLGVIAQEVAQLRPWALGPPVGGFLTVRMGLL